MEEVKWSFEMSGAEKKSSWTSQLGFILAAAGSAVGLGNIWRFPYRVANGGGGLFLVIYLILVFTFGRALLLSEVSIGRRTGKNPIDAFKKISAETGKNVKFIGYFSFIVPFIIYSYYTVIGGWVIWYLLEFLTMHVSETIDSASLGYFTNFITHPFAPVFYTLIFAVSTMIIVYKGVENGIEKFNKYIMPLLICIVIFLSFYSVFSLPHVEGRTGLSGLGKYLIPSFEGMTIGKFLNIFMSASAQLFYSISAAMGIMITYGSYCKKDVNLDKSVTQIEIFDTVVAFLAGVVVIPAVYVFMGNAGLEKAGPGLIFIALPMVFNSLGTFGTFLGILFFFLVLFAALTSNVSILETIVGNVIEVKHTNREKATLSISAIETLLSLIVCLGYTIFYFELKLPTGDVGQILDLFDYITNNFLMPIIAVSVCMVVGYVLKPKWVTDEIRLGGKKIVAEKMYIVLVKYIAPALLVILFLNSNGVFRFLGLN